MADRSHGDEKGFPVANPSHLSGCKAMGQQQLLLLLAAAMIVGLAIVAGIHQHIESAKHANQDQVRDALFEIAARAQGWYRRPTVLGGGGRSFAQIDWQKLAIDSVNASGAFAINNKLPGSFQVTAVSLEDTTWGLTLTVFPDDFALAP